MSNPQTELVEEKIEYAVITTGNRIVHMFTNEEMLNTWVERAKENGRYPSLRRAEVRTTISVIE